MCVCVRVLAEQACSERDKVKADLDHADQRNLQLVREVDDRHASMENLNQSRIRSDSHAHTGSGWPNFCIFGSTCVGASGPLVLCDWQRPGAGVP